MLGIIGGSGLYDLPGLTDVRMERPSSPFGEPSGEIRVGSLAGRPLAFLPRHGSGHRIPPGEINYRANIDALKRVGVTDLVSVSAVGSLREELAPGAFVLVDQFIDRTTQRQASFFGSGMVAHVSMAEPVCARLSDRIAAAADDSEIPVHRGGTYLVIEGPQFGSEAESRLYRQWEGDVIGMTNMPEAKLAREAELCYATIAMVTDYDCWHPSHRAVTVADVMSVMRANTDRVQQLLAALTVNLEAHTVACRNGCDRSLEHAVVTSPEHWDAAMVRRLDVVAGRIISIRRGGE